MTESLRTVGPMAVLELAPVLTYLGGRELLAHLMGAGPFRLHWLLDMSRVKYIDSAGLGALLDLHSQVRRRGGSLRLLQSPDRAKHLLALTGLNSILQNFESESDALASFAAAGGA